jgi:hypothetical protein
MRGRVTRRAGRILFFVLVCAACLAGVSAARGATPGDCQTLRKHGHRAEAQQCFASLIGARDPFIRAEGFWGIEQYEEANNQFRIATEQSPQNATIRVRWGRLMHERFNNTEADNLFGEALCSAIRKARRLITASRSRARMALTARPLNTLARRSNLIRTFTKRTS